ncbi:MAG: hypothetical protein DA407_07025, partial [Bacteroidetes bacterium]
MKRITFILIALCVTCFGFAQEDDDVSISKTTFGIKAGYNATQTKIVNETSESIRKEAGVYFGAFVNIPTTETFSIQPELLYSSSRYNINDNINLLHVPVSFKFELANNFTGFIGPEAQFLLGIGDEDKSLFNNVMFGFYFGANFEVAPNFYLE